MNYFRISYIGMQGLITLCWMGCAAPMEEESLIMPPASALSVITTTAVEELPATLGVYVLHRSESECSTQNQLFTSRNGQYESTSPLSAVNDRADASIIGYGPHTTAQLQGDSIFVNPSTNQQTEESYRNANWVWGEQSSDDTDKIVLPLQHKMSKLLIEVQYPSGVGQVSDAYVIEQMRLSGFQTSASFFPLQGRWGQYRSQHEDILPYGTGCNYRAFIVPQQPDVSVQIRFTIRQKSTGRTVEQLSFLSFAQTQHSVVSGQAYKVTLKVSTDFASSLQSRAAQQILSEVKVCEWVSGEVISLPTNQGHWLTSMGDRYGGQGTLQQPYLLRTAQDLADFANYVNGGNGFRSKYIRLDNDIDCTGQAFIPIGLTEEKPFRGIFQGNRHLISGIRYEQKSGTGTVVGGLFGWCQGATIQRVTVSGNFNIEAATCYAGGIVACATETTVEGCENRANLTVKAHALSGVAACVGGIVGQVAIVVSGSINTGKILAQSESAKVYVGGIQGKQLPGNVLIACINRGEVVGTGIQAVAAGLTAQAVGSVVSCYSVAAVSGGATSAALLSSDEAVTKMLSYCFFDTSLTSLPAHRVLQATALNLKAVYGMTATQLQTQFTIDDLNQGLFDWNQQALSELQCRWRFTPTAEKWPGVRSPI